MAASINKSEFDVALDDLCCRFIFNSPKEEHEHSNRILFQCERAWWYYCDFYFPMGKQFPELTFEQFVAKLFEKYPFFSTIYKQSVPSLIAQWRAYKNKVVVCGGALLNEDMSKILLVEGYQNSWSIPGGKINKDESYVDCAIRECYEEIGCDLSQFINENYYVDGPTKRLIRYFIVPNFPENFPFATKTRGEIKSIKWFKLNEIPYKSKKFRNTAHFIPQIIDWVKKNKGNITANNNVNCVGSDVAGVRSFKSCKFRDVFVI